jgi:hypothetical protein
MPGNKCPPVPPQAIRIFKEFGTNAAEIGGDRSLENRFQHPFGIS